ncbi:hypothetical protein MTO96_041506 [Rhipicephalus appendiculatus]
MDSGGQFGPIFGDDLLKTDPKVAKFMGDRDILVGQVANEGSLNLYSSFPDVFSKTVPPRNVSKSEMVYFLGALHNSLSLPEVLYLQDLYMGSAADKDYEQLRQALAQEQKDATVACATLDAALKLASATAEAGKTVFFYELNYVSQCSQAEPWLGMTHGDDTYFVFGRPLDKHKGCSDDAPFTRKVIEIWSDFAR